MSDFKYFLYHFRWFYVMCWAFPAWMYFDGFANHIAIITGIISTLSVTLIFPYVKYTKP